MLIQIYRIMKNVDWRSWSYHVHYAYQVPTPKQKTNIFQVVQPFDEEVWVIIYMKLLSHIIMMGRTPFYRTWNEIEHYFFEHQTYLNVFIYW